MVSYCTAFTTLYLHKKNNVLCLFFSGKLNFESAKSLYCDAQSVFEDLVLKTFDSSHTQFFMFYLCSFHHVRSKNSPPFLLCNPPTNLTLRLRLLLSFFQTFSDCFLKFLWQKASSPSTEPIYRQTALSYLASILARAVYIPIK